MAQLPILEFPDPRLRTVAAPVDPARVTGPEFQKLLDDMFETMYEAPGIGLAASQVDVHQRFMVIDISEEKNQPMVFINPEILKRKGTTEGEEGCLSFPGLYAPVKRAEEVVVEAFDLSGRVFEYELDELAARAVQHEVDHLDGVLFIDRLADAVRREHQPAITDFETKFRQRQAEGEIPSDEALKRDLAEREPK